MKVVVVTGTPGAGKTTVLNGALEMQRGKYELVNYGDEMFAAAKEEGIVKNRDEIRKQPSDVQKRIQKLAAKSIARKAEKKPVILDTHCTIKTPQGYLPGLPVWVLEELKPEKIILVETEPEEIRGRRKSDTTRERDAEQVADIEGHQLINRAAAIAYATLTGATVKIIKNSDGKLEEAIREMKAALE